MVYLVGKHLGVSDEQIQKGIAQYRPAAHRWVTTQVAGATVIDDAYNANPDGMIYALQRLKEYTQRKLLVFGDMLELGHKAIQYHQDMVSYIQEANISMVYTHGDITQHIDFGEIPHLHCTEKGDLIDMVKSELKYGDVLLVKGSRGLALDQVISAVQQKK